MARTPRFNDNVFINCPFDPAYLPLFESLVFTVYACGFLPRCAREESDSGEARVEKIARLIASSRYGIHDISRVQLDDTSALPRFNMPFELGLDLGCKRFGADRHRSKRLLVLDALPYRYQICLSDIAGQDILAHANNPEALLTHVREWLRIASRRTTVPGNGWIRRQYLAFAEALPRMCDESHLDRGALGYLDYVNLVEVWLRQASRD